MDKYATLEFNETYTHIDGDQYICMRNEFSYSILKRIGDGWEFKAYGVRLDENGMLYWSYSLGGCWA